MRYRRERVRRRTPSKWFGGWTVGEFQPAEPYRCVPAGTARYNVRGDDNFVLAQATRTPPIGLLRRRKIHVIASDDDGTTLMVGAISAGVHDAQEPRDVHDAVMKILEGRF